MMRLAHERGAPADQRIRVVIAEDSYLIRESLSQMLRGEPGVEVLAVCADARELQESIESLRPDVVITDIRMPPSGTDEGIRIAAYLRERLIPLVEFPAEVNHAFVPYRLDYLNPGFLLLVVGPALDVIDF